MKMDPTPKRQKRVATFFRVCLTFGKPLKNIHRLETPNSFAGRMQHL